MTAGRGIVHSEMPEQEDGLMQGFQLWVNLPAKDKMTEPRYQDIDPANIPSVALDNGGTVKVIAGAVNGIKGAVDTGVTEPTYLDVVLPAGATFAHPVTLGHNAFVYVYDGAVAVSGQSLTKTELGILGDGDSVEVVAGDAGAKVLIVAGKPLGEPVARHGPFVMNTMAEIRQAAEDYLAGRF